MFQIRILDVTEVYRYGKPVHVPSAVLQRIKLCFLFMLYRHGIKQNPIYARVDMQSKNFNKIRPVVQEIQHGEG